ncbi:hypothetical protein PR202_ga17999 [Eleusine coracana subsp. coracana]|uniref:Uncharacterized protein n=1 Tax=Eleusine coracana subsp. coracana TaxID=191504 RepID=A0AAV5CSE2_ELECO|nr:hypothetical protein PR202_ga17999 [Eleusine coracana subsp. coracana]
MQEYSYSCRNFFHLVPDNTISKPLRALFPQLHERISSCKHLSFVLSEARGKTGITLTDNSITETLLSSSEEQQAEAKRPCPYGRASLLELVTFSWMNPVFATGYKKPLEKNDVPAIDDKDSAKLLSDSFQNIIDDVEHRHGLSTSSIYIAIFLFIRQKAMINAGFAVLKAGASYVGPSLINDLVKFLGGERQYGLKRGYILAVAFLSAKVVETIAQRQWIFGARQLGLRLRAALISHIYQKGLRLSCSSRQKHTSGEIINYMSVDIQRITDVIWERFRLIEWQNTLQEEELKYDATTELPRDNTDYDVEIDHGIFSWELETIFPTLTDVDLKVKRGMKVAISGMVGSGKSSLLSCILGEMPKLDGTVRVSERKAYVPQTAWILSGNIRDNILFGNSYDKEKYEKTIKACALTKDLELFAHGDMTEIGERGINLSGGQKQRIQIARSVYEDADIYLFDDPFSAVDAHTGSQLFKVMQGGKIVQKGKFDELLQQNIGFEGIVGAHSQALESVINAESSSRIPLDNRKSADTEDKFDTESEIENQLQGITKQESAHDVSEDISQKGRLTQDEEREKGGIGKKASNDQSVLDLEIANKLGWCVFSVIQVLGTIGVMSQRYYIPTARELARLTQIQRAPILHHFAESLAGASSIRAYGQKERFRKANLGLVDNHSRAWFHIISAVEWLCFRLNMLSNFVYAFSLILLVSLPEGFINPSIAGLALTYALNLNSQLASIAWNICDTENKMISVERLMQYSRIPSEAPLVVECCQPANNWPEDGTINIKSLEVRYAEHLPSVLRNISCMIPGRKKVGIVGRTGSGKSTFIQALFRIVEPREGTIEIDSVDICKIGLHDLRSRLSIIPQDPTMFEGTVRGNLDPLNEYSDQRVWEILDKCQLGDMVRKNPKKLDSTVVENGENWSVGQRQLFCLGRILLKRSNVLVLDEATASVDSSTDAIIQETIRKEFRDCTVLTIAHRINTVIDSDLIIVFSEGKIIEYDTPYKLLENKNSEFSRLIKEYSTRSHGFNNTAAN